jgi:hypothetical protein
MPVDGQLRRLMASTSPRDAIKIVCVTGYRDYVRVGARTRRMRMAMANASPCSEKDTNSTHRYSTNEQIRVHTLDISGVLSFAWSMQAGCATKHCECSATWIFTHMGGSCVTPYNITEHCRNMGPAPKQPPKHALRCRQLHVLLVLMLFPASLFWIRVRLLQHGVQHGSFWGLAKNHGASAASARASTEGRSAGVRTKAGRRNGALPCLHGCEQSELGWVWPSVCNNSTL